MHISFGHTYVVHPDIASRLASISSIREIEAGMFDGCPALFAITDGTWLPAFLEFLGGEDSRIAYLGADGLTVAMPPEITLMAAGVKDILDALRLDPLLFLNWASPDKTFIPCDVVNYASEIEELLSRPPELPSISSDADGYPSHVTVASYLHSHLALLQVAASSNLAIVNIWC